MIKNEQHLNYRIVGEGYPVVFLHGFLENNSMWDAILDGLPNIQSICIELPGHGESPLPKADLSLPLISQLVKHTIQSLSINPFSIVGHSLGGYVALYLTEESALAIEHIVLLHSHPWADSKIKKTDRNRVAKIVDYNKILFLKEAIPSLYYQPDKYETQINHLIEDAYGMSKASIMHTLFALRDRQDNTPTLEKFRQNIHIIQGEYDPLIDAKAMEEAARKAGNNFHLIKAIGHMGHHESTEEVINLLRFLQTL